MIDGLPVSTRKNVLPLQIFRTTARKARSMHAGLQRASPINESAVSVLSALIEHIGKNRECVSQENQSMEA
jgi:hypothetical protein